jgi:hypothetical protein
MKGTGTTETPSVVELRRLARQAMTEAKERNTPEISTVHPVIVQLCERVAEANKDLKLTTVDTLNLVLRRMRLGYAVTYGPRHTLEAPARAARQSGSAPTRQGNSRSKKG